MEFLNTSIIISTVHAAKGLEWDYVILPDMEKDSFPNWYGLCGRCKNGNDCNFVMTKDIEKSFFEELSVFYVAVTRAKKQVFFTASHKQLTNRGIFEKNYSFVIESFYNMLNIRSSLLCKYGNFSKGIVL